MNYFWQSFREFWFPEKKVYIGNNDNNQQHGQQSSTRDGSKSEPRNKSRLMSIGIPTITDTRDLFSVFVDQMNQMNQMIEEFSHPRDYFNGNEYFYENTDDNGNYVKVYTYESGPQMFLNGERIEMKQAKKEPKDIRDLVLKPEYRKKKQKDENLDGKIGIEDIRNRFF